MQRQSLGTRTCCGTGAGIGARRAGRPPCGGFQTLRVTAAAVGLWLTSDKTTWHHRRTPCHTECSGVVVASRDRPTQNSTDTEVQEAIQGSGTEPDSPQPSSGQSHVISGAVRFKSRQFARHCSHRSIIRQCRTVETFDFPKVFRRGERPAGADQPPTPQRSIPGLQLESPPSGVEAPARFRRFSRKC